MVVSIPPGGQPFLQLPWSSYACRLMSVLSFFADRIVRSALPDNDCRLRDVSTFSHVVPVPDVSNFLDVTPVTSCHTEYHLYCIHAGPPFRTFLRNSVGLTLSQIWDF